MDVLARTIRERTHGEPPNRAAVPGSDDKWDGYLLGVEEASVVADELLRGAVSGLESGLREALTSLNRPHPEGKRIEIARHVIQRALDHYGGRYTAARDQPQPTARPRV